MEGGGYDEFRAIYEGNRDRELKADNGWRRYCKNGEYGNILYQRVKDLDSSDNKKTVYVYRVYLKEQKVLCLITKQYKDEILVKIKEIPIKKLEKYMQKGDFEERELVGFSVKKDGSFKIKPKQLKPYLPILEARGVYTPPFYKELKENAKIMKEQEREQEEEELDFD